MTKISVHAAYRNVRKPKAGDLAYHKSGLDAREVAQVDGDSIYLYFLTPGEKYGPFPASNYTFRRRVK